MAGTLTSGFSLKNFADDNEALVDLQGTFTKA
jgi:hypothetical protein